MKTCTKCGETKSIAMFTKDKKTLDGLDLWCKLCKNQSRITWQKNNPSKVKNKNLMRDYKISNDTYNQMRNEQNNCCAICGVHQNSLKISLCVDHNHNTQKIRGLLCSNCNRGIGYLQDNPEILKKAVNYLQERM